MHEDRIASTRRKRFDLLRTIGVEHDLSRSHSTFEECRNKARHIFGGARVVKNSNKMLTVRPGEINSQVSGPGVFQLGNGDDLIEHEPIYATNDLTDDQNGTADETAQATSSEKTTRAPKPEATSQENKQLPIGRPKTKGSFA